MPDSTLTVLCSLVWSTPIKLLVFGRAWSASSVGAGL